MEHICDHSNIHAMEINGFLGKIAPAFPHCPFCGAACEEIKYDQNGDPYACDICEKSMSAWDEPMCFPEDEDGSDGLPAEGLITTIKKERF